MKFCFFGDISQAIVGKTNGGGQLQVFLLAKALAKEGHEVVVIDPYYDKCFTTSDGIKVVTVPEWRKGFKGMRFFWYRMPALNRLFTQLDADYYYVRMRSFINLIPYFVAKRNSRKFILAIASDVDVLSLRKKYKYEYKSNFSLFTFFGEFLLNDLATSYLLKRSDYVLLQHSGQKYNSASKSRQVIFSNIIDLDNLPATSETTGDYYIYVGALTMLKGADKLLELISSVDCSIPFVIVGLPNGEEPKRIYNELSKKPNVTLKGYTEHKTALQLISNAKALINTSYYEGFPNIFLEAWATGVPVISLTVNPGNLFNKYRLGVYCHSSMVKMKQAIEMHEAERVNKEELRQYVLKHHDLKSAASKFLNAIAQKTYACIGILLSDNFLELQNSF